MYAQSDERSLKLKLPHGFQLTHPSSLFTLTVDLMSYVYLENYQRNF